MDERQQKQVAIALFSLVFDDELLPDARKTHTSTMNNISKPITVVDFRQNKKMSEQPVVGVLTDSAEILVETLP